MNKLYVKAPLVLGAICVCSAGLIGGVHALTNWYNETHPSTGTPKNIQKLDKEATFEAVEGFEEKTELGDYFKVTLESCYAMYQGGVLTGYAYEVDSGKPVKTEVTFTVAFQGDVTEATKSSFNPTAIVVVSGGDSGYEKNVTAYAAAIVSGTKGFSDTSGIVSGGTKSQRSLRDGLIAARNDYVTRWNANN